MLGSGAVLLAVTVLLVAWLGSFNSGQFSPADPHQTVVFWATSALIFILMVTLGFILFRELAKLYIARQSNQQGSRIRTKLVLGALALSCVPVFFLVLFSFYVLSHSVNRWFTNPVDQTIERFVKVAELLQREMQDEVNAQTALLAAQPEVRRILAGGAADAAFLQRFTEEHDAETAVVYGPDGTSVAAQWTEPGRAPGQPIRSRAPVVEDGQIIGYAELAARLPLDVADQLAAVERFHGEAIQLKDQLKTAKVFYNMVMGLITVFVLFFATWVAFFLAKQISVPISALLDAAHEVSKGNLKHRVEVRASDELGSLVRAFNRMTEDLDSGNRELDRRRRFIEAILESIPTGVISIGADGSIHHVNRALSKIFAPERGGAGEPPGRPVFARGHGRDQVPHEEGAAHRDRFQADGAADGYAQAATGGDGVGARREADLGVRGGARGHQRAAARAEGGGVARGGAAGGARDQEPAHAHRAFRGTDRPPGGPAGAAAGHGPHSARVRVHHLEIGGVGEDAGGRVLAIRALSHGPAGAQRSEPGGGGSPRGVRGAAGRHHHADQLRARTCRR